MNLSLTVSGKTDIGLVRSGNEDSLTLDFDNNLFVVCDGMGGHKAGEVASSEACDIIRFCFSDLADMLANDLQLIIPVDFPSRGLLLVQAIRLANRSVYKRSRSHSDYAGMGTTVAAVAFEDDLICIAHVGDSRVYRLTPTELIPLTTDHSWISELQQSGQFSEAEAAQIINRNVITRALGINEKVEVDFRAQRVEEGSVYILCSDGLCGYAADEEIFSVASGCDEDIHRIVNDLVQLANDRGGQDNVTVVAVRVDKIESEKKLPEVKPVTVSGESDDALQRENEILATVKKPEVISVPPASPVAYPSQRFPLVLIFAAFIIIAALIVYLVTLK
ncbi:MAG: Stp1/IreP family PP2C-type Ser/Thr phosphatase [Candidatus Zixiibacteriota bacterium]|nr:MAG: Stp1/IreP family PP2C-type Ser/Thr phosphatase [candidate division Zixibacteria bacterium]